MSSSTVQTPFPVPSRLDALPPPELSEKEQAGYDSVLAHFSNPDYVLPGVDTEEGMLMEEERMWLVRLPLFSIHSSFSILTYRQPVVRVHPALLTCREIRSIRERQAPRSGPQMEARLWSLRPRHARARRARIHDRQHVSLWVRPPR